jgi:hypothetical protein
VTVLEFTQDLPGSSAAERICYLLAAPYQAEHDKYTERTKELFSAVYHRLIMFEDEEPALLPENRKHDDLSGEMKQVAVAPVDACTVTLPEAIAAGKRFPRGVASSNLAHSLQSAFVCCLVIVFAAWWIANK